MQVSGTGLQLNTPPWLPRAANPPETVQRAGALNFFFLPMGGGNLLFCFYGDFGGMFAVNMSGGGRAGGSESVSAAQRLACDQLFFSYCG